MASSAKKGLKKGQELTYKGKALVRKGNMLYYGNGNEKYIITMKIMESEKIKDLKVATKVSIELQKNDPSLRSREKVVKKAEREGLYQALDIGTIWLEDALGS
ncbi:MAG: hypothetical protein MJB12_14385 [Firmicutes bacterium]|nr:hypothetical protein [Bacillota bacterium]